MRLTRRKLAAGVAAAAASWLAAAPLVAQTAAPGQPRPALTPDDELKAARDRLKTNGDTLAQHDIPVATEPAFQFRA
jgi:hypothetical protein